MKYGLKSGVHIYVCLCVHLYTNVYIHMFPSSDYGENLGEEHPNSNKHI